MEEIKTQRLYAQILYQKSQFMTHLLRRDSRSDLSDKDPYYSRLCTGVCESARERQSSVGDCKPHTGCRLSAGSQEKSETDAVRYARMSTSSDD